MKTNYLIALALFAAGSTAAWANEPYFPRAEKAFQRMDANKDGKLTPDEMKPIADKRLVVADTNGDKAVTIAEFDALLAKRLERRRARMFQLLDADKDGKITEAELNAVVDNMMASADTDKDGAVTMAEAQAFKRSKWRKALVETAPSAN